MTVETQLTGKRWWLACLLVFAGALAAIVPTTGDMGLTWDEPAYRFSQQRSADWWHRLANVRDRPGLEAVVDSDALLFYWTYARHGINFHPPLAGQLNLVTHAAFGQWMKDTPSRRMASVIEYALTLTIGFGFLARRYGTWVGLVASGSLLLMPRVYGDMHLATTDPPGLLLWSATAIAFWNGLDASKSRGWRVLVGVLLGLAFLEKMAAVFVIVPIVLWLVVARLPRSFDRTQWRDDWTDGLVTTGAMLIPLGLAFVEILRLTKQLPIPLKTNLFAEHPQTFLPGLILAGPLLVWMIRRLLGRIFPESVVWGVDRPGLEIWTAILAFAPVVGWLGNPAWWRETLPRLAHYAMINIDRRGSLPDIQIYYFGQTYEYSLPWHNAWVLIAITVPVTILAAAVIGFLYGLRVVRRDQLPLFFLLHFVTIPIARMLPTPAHDGVRLMLPTFFFLAGFAGWGAVWLADGLARLSRERGRQWFRAGMAALVLVPSAWQLVKIHPYELSYYNELIGGPRGAWKAGFELTYWYDAFNPPVLAVINSRLTDGSIVDFFNDKTNPMTFAELQSLGELKPGIDVGIRKISDFPHAYVWLLTQDSKASAFTRLLFAMKPWYESRPKQVDGLRVLAVADPIAVSRAWVLQLMLDAADVPPKELPPAPTWVYRYAPVLGRLWGEGVTKTARLNINGSLFEWAKTDPKGFLEAARILSKRRDEKESLGAIRLKAILDRYSRSIQGEYTKALLEARPEAILEAARIVVDRPEALRSVLTRYGYTDPADIGGFLDSGLTPPVTQPFPPRDRPRLSSQFSARRSNPVQLPRRPRGLPTSTGSMDRTVPGAGSPPNN